MKFVGGLLIKPVESRLEFPFAYTYQSYHLGGAIYPKSLSSLSSSESKTMILQRLNQLAEFPATSFPNLEDRIFQKKVEKWMEKTKVSEVKAVLYQLFAEIEEPSDEVKILLAGIKKGNFKDTNSPEEQWLKQFGEWLIS